MSSILYLFAYFNQVRSFFQAYSFDATDQNQDCWNITNIENSMFRTCNSQRIFGGPYSFGMNTYLTRFFNNLDPHYLLKVEIELWIIDKWTSDSINIEIDNTLQFSKSYLHTGMSPDYCGTGSLLMDDDDDSIYNDELESISITIPHKKRSAWIHIYTDFTTNEKQSWGIKTFKLSVKKCLNECLACSGIDYPQCSKWQKHTQSFSQSYISGFDQWDGLGFSLTIQLQDNCSSCHYLQGMKFRRSLILQKNQQILLRLFKFDTNNFKISLNNIYYKIIYNSNGYIEILIDDWKSEIQEILFESLQQELKIRDIDIYVADFEENNIILFISGCNYFINQICNQCYDGWNYIEHNNICQPQCGDKIIVGYEECDDGNNISHDGCFECKYQCNQNCNVCQFGKCLECFNNFELTSDQQCLPVCGDGFIVPYTKEKCEDGNSIEDDGCFNCNFECDQTCNICYLKKCLECQRGYQLIDNQCHPYCGDKIVINDFEDCDDGNFLPFDGCFECKFQCFEGCIICQEGKCNVTQCEKGYELISGQCISICGDKYITQQEECDDSNDFEYDGCHICKYSCPLNCFDCFQGQCLVCEEQYELTKNGQCQQNTIINEDNNYTIECYDGNDLPNDGCYNQMVEFNWVCSEYSIDMLSQCTFSVNPKLTLTFLNYTSDTQYVMISFNEQVSTTSEVFLSNTMEIQVINITKEKQQLTLSIIQDASLQISKPEYVIAVQIFQQLDFKPILEIKLNQQIVNKYGASVISNQHHITLIIPNYLDEVQTTYSIKLQQVNKSFIYAVLSIGALSLLFGLSEVFLQIINILQYQQYLRYLNLEFPKNLLIYFELGDLLQSQTLMDYFKIQNFFYFFQMDSNVQSSYEKFYYYNLNADLLQNLQWQLFQCITCLLILSIISVLKRVFYYYIFTDKFTIYVSVLFKCLKNQFVIKISQGLYKLAKLFLSIEKVATYNGLRQLLLINGWDLIFKTLLYFQSINSIYVRDSISIVLGTCILTTYFVIMILACNRETLMNKRKLKSALLKRYQIFNLLRQTCFLTVLVFFQKQKILQIMLIAIICVLCLKIVYNYRKVFELSNFLIQFIVEGSIILFTITSLVYADDYAMHTNQELKVKLGWFHISILSIGLFVQLIMIIYERIRSLYKKHQQGKEKLIQIRQNSHLILVEIKNRVVIQIQ